MLPCMRIQAFAPASCFSSLCRTFVAQRVQSVHRGWILRSVVAAGPHVVVVLMQSSVKPRKPVKFSELFGFAAFSAWFRNLME
jgi:hypothetical protein